MTVLEASTKILHSDASKGASGPPLEVSFSTTQDQITSITLSPCEQFTCQVDTDSPSLRNAISQWISAYLARKSPPCSLPLDLSSLSPFTKKGLMAIAAIPFGNVSSYKEIAERAGNPRGARAIGGVCNRNPFPLVIPCHRVIASDGTLGGFAYPLEVKQNLLSFESRF